MRTVTKPSTHPDLAHFRQARDMLIPRDQIDWFRTQQSRGRLSIKPKPYGGAIIQITQAGEKWLASLGRMGEERVG